jgi:ATP-dependent Clp protease protease subunit
MGAVILACAAKRGNRRVTRNAQVLIHQIHAQFSGSCTDVQITLEHTNALGNLVNKLLAEACGCDQGVIERATDRDKWMSADEAVMFGLADKVVDWK